MKMQPARRLFVAPLLLAIVSLFPASVPAQSGDKKPNILFIMGDDIGYQPRCCSRGVIPSISASKGVRSPQEFARLRRGI